MREWTIAVQTGFKTIRSLQTMAGEPEAFVSRANDPETWMLLRAHDYYIKESVDYQCPNCGFVNEKKPDNTAGIIVTMESFNDDGRDEKMPVIRTCDDLSHKYICQHCGITLFGIDQEKQFTFRLDRHRLTVITEMEFSFKMSWLESVEFNFRKGRVIGRFTDSDGQPFSIKDLTYTTEPPALDVFRFISQSEELRREISRCFEEIRGECLPFSPSELNGSNLRLLTIFNRRYRRPFYDALPVTAQGLLDRSFIRISKQMRDPKRVRRAFAAYGLPKAKSIKRVFFRQPANFLCCPEHKLLFDVVGDPDDYRDLIVHPEVFALLATLHIAPRSAEFISDYVTARGFFDYYRLLSRKRWEIVTQYMIKYPMLSHEQKRYERNKWHNNIINLNPVFPGFRFPEPYVTQQRDVEIFNEEYVFTLLDSTLSIAEAGGALHNCFVYGRTLTDSIVYSVSFRKELCAIVEVDIRENEIIQKKAENNAEVQDEGLLQAIKDFCVCHGYDDFT